LVAAKSNSGFGPAAFLAQSGIGRRRMFLKPRETFFTQGDQADLRLLSPEWSGKAHSRVTGRQRGTITLLSPGEFVGEESLTTVPGLRLSTATAVSTCAALKITREEMIRQLHEEPAFATSSSSSCLDAA